MSKAILIFIILIVLILGIIFLWWPKYQDFDLLKFKAEEKKLELENKEEYFSHLNNLSLKLKEYSGQLAKIETALPKNLSAIPNLLYFLQKKSEESGLILEDVRLAGISPLEKGSRIQKISLDLSLIGPYPALKNFLSSLGRSARIIEVESINFSYLKEKPFIFRLKIKTYSY